MKDITAYNGLGFRLQILAQDEKDSGDFVCDFHKLDGDEPMPCLQAPLFYFGVDSPVQEEGFTMCAQHYSQFVDNMLSALETFERHDTHTVPDKPELTDKEGALMSYAAFRETFMRIKASKQTAH